MRILASVVMLSLLGCSRGEPGKVIINGHVVIEGENLVIDGATIEPGEPAGESGTGGRVIIRGGRSK